MIGTPIGFTIKFPIRGSLDREDLFIVYRHLVFLKPVCQVLSQLPLVERMPLLDDDE